jgi:hypothetical protein
MTSKEKSEHAQRLLAAYIREIKRYKAIWQIPPDRYVHLNAWAKAKRENCLPNRRVPAALMLGE